MKRMFRCLLALTLLSVYSCKQKLSTSELLTDGGWTLKTLTVNPSVTVNGVVITDYYNQLYDFDKDNILTFNDNGTFTSDEGALKEHPSDPQTKQGQWLLSASEDMITVFMNEDTVVYALADVSEDDLTLVYSQRDTVTQINYSFTAGFKH